MTGRAGSWGLSSASCDSRETKAPYLEFFAELDQARIHRAGGSRSDLLSVQFVLLLVLQARALRSGDALPGCLAILLLLVFSRQSASGETAGEG